VFGGLEAIAVKRHRFAAPQHALYRHVFFEIPDAAHVRFTARRPHEIWSMLANWCASTVGWRSGCRCRL
jgi:hypothetical protein